MIDMVYHGHQLRILTGDVVDSSEGTDGCDLVLESPHHMSGTAHAVHRKFSAGPTLKI